MKKKIVTLGLMMVLSMTAVPDAARKQELKQQLRQRLRARRQIPQPQMQPRIQRRQMRQELRQQRQRSLMTAISMHLRETLWRRQKIRAPMCWM